MGSNSTKSFWEEESEKKERVEVIDEKRREPIRKNNINESIKHRDNHAISPDSIQEKSQLEEKKPKIKERVTNNSSVQPEEVILKKKNKKDLIIIVSVVIALIAGIVFGTVYIYNSGNRQIYSYIDSGSYAVAYKEINSLYNDGKNVDSLVIEYMKACVKDREYRRAVFAVDMLSNEGYSKNKEFLEQLAQELNSNGKESLYQKMNSFIESHK